MNGTEHEKAVQHTLNYLQLDDLEVEHLTEQFLLISSIAKASVLMDFEIELMNRLTGNESNADMLLKIKKLIKEQSTNYAEE